MHISDTHIGTNRDYRLLDINTFESATKLVEAINNIPEQPDFIIHTGDVASVDGETEAYELARHLFSHLKAPIYFVSGNHDISANLIKTLEMPEKKHLTDTHEVSNSYYFTINNTTFVILDGRGPREIDPHGVISQAQLMNLKKLLSETMNPLVIFVHFPALSLDSTWIDRDMLLTNGNELHQILLKEKDKIMGVFSGHVHRGIIHYHDGILYSSVGSTFCQFIAWPGQELVLFDRLPVGFYNYVTIDNHSVLIKELAYDFRHTI